MKDTISDHLNWINRRLTRLSKGKQETIKNKLHEIQEDKSLSDEGTEAELMKIIAKIRRPQ